MWSVVDDESSLPLANHFSCADNDECSHICAGVFDDIYVNDNDENEDAFTVSRNAHDDVKDEKNSVASVQEPRSSCLCPLGFRIAIQK